MAMINAEALKKLKEEFANGTLVVDELPVSVALHELKPHILDYLDKGWGVADLAGLVSRELGTRIPAEKIQSLVGSKDLKAATIPVEKPSAKHRKRKKVPDNADKESEPAAPEEGSEAGQTVDPKTAVAETADTAKTDAPQAEIETDYDNAQYDSGQYGQASHEQESAEPAQQPEKKRWW